MVSGSNQDGAAHAGENKAGVEGGGGGKRKGGGRKPRTRDLKTCEEWLMENRPGKYIVLDASQNFKVKCVDCGGEVQLAPGGRPQNELAAATFAKKHEEKPDGMHKKALAKMQSEPPPVEAPPAVVESLPKCKGTTITLESGVLLSEIHSSLVKFMTPSTRGSIIEALHMPVSDRFRC